MDLGKTTWSMNPTEMIMEDMIEVLRMTSFYLTFHLSGSRSHSFLWSADPSEGETASWEFHVSYFQWIWRNEQNAYLGGFKDVLVFTPVWLGEDTLTFWWAYSSNGLKLPRKEFWHSLSSSEKWRGLYIDQTSILYKSLHSGWYLIL